MISKKTIIRLITYFTAIFFIAGIGIAIENCFYNIPFDQSFSNLNFYYIPLSIATVASIFSCLYWHKNHAKIEETNKYSANLKALLDINSSFISTLQLNELLQIIIDESTKFINLDTGAIYLLESGAIYLGATTPPLPDNIPEVARHDKLENHLHIQQSLKQKKPVYIPDITHEPLTESEKNIVEQRHLKSLLYIPLIIENRPVGVLILGTNVRKRQLSPQEIEMCMTFSSEAALAIENARLFKASELSSAQLKIQNEEIVKINEELNKAKKNAEESDQLKTAFLNNLSHEIRTPLNSVVGFSNLLAEDDLDQKTIDSYAKTIQKSSTKLLDIMSDVIEISKIHTGQTKLLVTEFQIFKVIHNTVEELKPQSKFKGLNIDLINQLPKKNYTIKSDQEKIKKILYHLIDNSIKYTHNGGVNVTIENGKGNVYITVKDTGIGVDEKYHSEIFKPFRQVANTNIYDYGGNGIGLAIVDEYTSLLNGTIDFKSRLGKGTKVKLTIPINQKEDYSI